MTGHTPARICLTPRVSGVGGMVSFRRKMTAGLHARGVAVTHALEDPPYESVLVIGGTRQLWQLWRARRSGARIVQRLNGMNWLHRQRKTGLRHYLRSEYGNLILRLIRDRLADHVVYQSGFARRWWERKHGPAPVPSSVVYNGVDLSIYTPEGPHDRPINRYRLLLVEGSLAGGYEIGLTTAIQLARRLITNYQLPTELTVAGKVDPQAKTRWNAQDDLSINWLGPVPGDAIPALDRSAHALYAADLNAACPNSVVEALACGLPVVAFDTGALPELLTPSAGRVARYGGDPWQLDPPDVDALARGTAEVLTGGETFREGARARAEKAVGLEKMVEKYLEALH